MILGFKTAIKGKPTGFVEKINDGSKIHTLREDKYWRWRPGMSIEFATGVRTKQYKQFKRSECTATQRVYITAGEHTRLEMSVDGNYLYYADMVEFAKNDGFDTIDAFFDWFEPLVKEAEQAGKFGVSLTLIHWTDKRY